MTTPPKTRRLLCEDCGQRYMDDTMRPICEPAGDGSSSAALYADGEGEGCRDYQRPRVTEVLGPMPKAKVRKSKLVKRRRTLHQVVTYPGL